MPLLIHRSAPRDGKRHAFDRTVILGRGPLADVGVTEPSVSRRHAQISLADGRCFLADLGSGNGTFLNGRLLAGPEALTDGDEVRVGAALFEFRERDERVRERTRSLSISIRESIRPSGPSPLVIPLAELSDSDTSANEEARLRRRLEFFREAGQILTRTLDERELFDALLEKAMEALPQAGRAFVMRRDPESGELSPLAARTRDGAAEEIPASRTLIDAVVRRKEPLVSVDAASEAGFEAARSVRHLNLRAVACMPLLVEDRLIGVLQVDNAEERRGFRADDLDLLAGIAGPIALALEHSRLHRELVTREVLEHDLALARRIQRSFLPTAPPAVRGYRISVEYSPAFEVGGDLYDLFPLPGGKLGIAIGDVSGKGVSGALLMARLTSALRTAAARSEHPSMVLEELNELILRENSDGMFVTALYGVLDLESGRVELANAGHLRPIVRHRDGRTGELKLPAGGALGVQTPLDAPAVSWTISPGDLVLFSTDGLSEAANQASERFQVSRIVETLRSVGSGEPRAALDALLTAAREFSRERGFDDDLTVLCLARDAAS